MLLRGLIAVLGSILALDLRAETNDRFRPHPGFRVEEVVAPDATGSLVNMAFDADGQILASRENGPLLSIRDLDRDGQFETISPYCAQVKNCHGILPVEGGVFVVGDGPQGAGFYRLTDADGDHVADRVKPILKFRGSMGEHGPHAAVRGPDGLIYIMIGNHAGVQRSFDATSPHHHYYDGELIEPKYEDANGHAAGIKAPGGTVVRTDEQGQRLELFCGGFRNAFDIGVSRDGHLFTFDSDMEWDVNLPWYRPTRVNHLLPGAEFGWRSGWSKWPDFYVDSLPSAGDLGRGSPTGLEFYNHVRLGPEYRDALFMCDWSQGRILAVRFRPDGGTFAGESEVFLEGTPLNCSDIAVGPDGWLYFCVGGRQTAGSIFRIVRENAPPLAEPPDDPVERALAQPQYYSAWARSAVERARAAAGEAWPAKLTAVARDVAQPVERRLRAVDLLHDSPPDVYGQLLLEISHDQSPPIREKAAYLLGLAASDFGGARLVELIDDPDSLVRRTAIESLVRGCRPVPLEKLLPRLAERDRFVAWAARRALERLPRESWPEAVLASDNARTFINGALALLVLDPDPPTVQRILVAASERLRANWPADDLVDLVRIVELAVYRGRLEGNDLPETRQLLLGLYPSGDWRIDRLLVRLLCYLQEPAAAEKLAAALAGDAPLAEKLHVAMHARWLLVGWTPETRGQLLAFYDFAQRQEGGNSFRGYLRNATNDFVRAMSSRDQWEQILAGAGTPAVTLGLVESLPKQLSAEQQASLRALDRDLAAVDSPEARQLARAVLVALGRGDDRSLEYLHQVFESSPDRRPDVAQVIAARSQRGQRRTLDWQLLARSLSVVEGSTARDVLKALAKFPDRATKPELQRQAIIVGLKLADEGGQEAAELLAHWTGGAAPRTTGAEAMTAWQAWFVEHYPDQPEPALPADSAGNKWSMAQLQEHLANSAGRGDRQRGAAVFEKALCIKCHRFGNRGEGVGPDLTNVASRFQRREILESVLSPSQVISDQFASKSVITSDGRTLTGLVGPTADGVVVLQANTEKVNVAKADIDQIVPSKKSAMPEELFNNLSLDEIADLLAYLKEAGG